MKARLIQEIGTRAYLRVYWGGHSDGNLCPNCGGSGKPGFHNAEIRLIDSNVIHDWELGGKPDSYPDSMWPTKCDGCGAEIPAHARRQIFRERLYNTASGKPEPGDLYWADWYPEDLYWDNHKGPHLMAVLPNGNHWCIDSRASNCTMPNDRTHRCWCWEGQLPNITVGKHGYTCQAGAGSIISGNYHGFLINGEFTEV
jgi:hypothetical protein